MCNCTCCSLVLTLTVVDLLEVHAFTSLLITFTKPFSTFPISCVRKCLKDDPCIEIQKPPFCKV
jgi:hypothetical protein